MAAGSGGNQLYGRRCRLSIAVPVATPGDYTHTTADVIEVGGGDDGTTPGLRVAFKVSKTREKQPNTAEISVYNLAPLRRASLQTKGVKVLLEAGYQATGVTGIFQGDVRTIDHVRDGADWRTVIKCGDGERAFRYARASESFAAGTTVGTVLQHLAAAMGLQLGNTSAVAASMSTPLFAGYVVHGSAQQALDRLVRSLGYGWSIQDGALQVLLPGDVLPDQIPELSPATGLIGSPEMGTPEKKGQPALVKVRALLFPTRPGAVVRLVSDRYRGQVAVRRATWDGDTHGDAWYTDVEGVIRGQ